MTHTFSNIITIRRPIEEVFDFFSRAENLERITPPELRFRILTPGPVDIRAGTIIDYELRLMGVPFRWRTQISEWEPPHAFVDTQVKGPYALWVHRHSFRREGDATTIEDTVRYRLPLTPLGDVAWPFVRLQIGRIFAYRETAIRRAMES
jgi:ligand-binding SRPBCC domain-containing protein